MPELYLYNILSNIKRRDIVAIYGTSRAALEIKKYIQEKRKDVKIAFFVEYNIKETQYLDGILIIDFKEFLKRKNEIDNVIITKDESIEALTSIFRQSDISYVQINEKDLLKLSYKNFEKVKKMFESTYDKELFTIIYLSSLTDDFNVFENFLKEHPLNEKQHKYLEFMRRNDIKTIIDTGESNGYYSMYFQNELKNVEKIYCFDSLHDYVSDGLFLTKKYKELTFYKIIQYSKKIQMVGNILWDTKDSKQFLKKGLHTITLDEYKHKNHLKIDYIKFDLEGIELNVLKGCFTTFKKDRPYIVIRIYKKPCRDYIEILLLLNKVLKNYSYKIGIYDSKNIESVLYCIPN